MTGQQRFETHEVFNQPPAFENINLYTSNAVLMAAVEREGGGAAAGELAAYGERAGSSEMLRAGRLANEFPPQLKSFDARGQRVDAVEFHPAYHELMACSAKAGMHCRSWEDEPGRNVARAAIVYLGYQMEPGHTCPLVMTNACVAAMRHQPALAEIWQPRIVRRAYDGADIPASEKSGVTIGMGMTEKQGGTDVRANTTRAEPAGSDGEYVLVGHKWFMSAPMCDGFLVLAQALGGLSCFLMPRFLPDGSRNPMNLMRLKGKLGNWSNASSEVEFAGVHGWLVGEEGRGVATIIEMVTFTRLDCAVASAGLMRWGLANALHHTSHRTVFQKKLIDQPLMRTVLADLSLDCEAATALTFRLARAFDNQDDEFEQAFARLMTPAIKYWVCKSAPGFTYEAMECLGGGGYVEEGPMAWAFREAPLNAIWEGSGNVMCLDVARVAARAPETLERIVAWLSSCGDKRIASAAGVLAAELSSAANLEADLRVIVERLVLLAAGAILLEAAPATISESFIASRLEGGFRTTYGQLNGADISGILSARE
ncbi:MAG: acyl-CoA dehydrogenase family protein [Hyphomicrobiales bacterium]